MPGAASGGAWLGVIVPQFPCEDPEPIAPCSRIVTERPAFSRSSAQARPMTPPPRTRTSVSCVCMRPMVANAALASHATKVCPGERLRRAAGRRVHFGARFDQLERRTEHARDAVGVAARDRQAAGPLGAVWCDTADHRGTAT